MEKAACTGSISVFFPAFNDEQSITALIGEAIALLPKLTDDYEVIVVNDGSQDQTGKLLNELLTKLPRLTVIHHPVNRGYGAALRSGFGAATKDLIFYTDGDGQYDVRELASLLEHLGDRVDVVNGYKISRSDSSSRVILGTIYSRVARLFFRLPIRDVDCDFRLIRRRAIDQIELTSSSGVVCAELVRKLKAADCIFTEVPVHHYPRRYGQSQFFTIPRVARTVLDLGILWLRLVVWPRLSPASMRRRSLPVETSGE